MEKKLTPKLKLFREEFNFSHKKIGKLEWELATIYYKRKAVASSEFKTLEDRLENYRVNISILVETIKNEVAVANKSK
ncbi:hypothetical protein CSV71_00645 [Sporosarcina sp. P21c]|uniref:hypothetical protein n=1 Tax=unclassified Sporosarcina TaxID=2647733 RepID=UPI000C16F70E|nr:MULTISPECIES: hypothetical protein [unclassified Sporosarcina]PIC68661.1 hypothetical protein CSV78_00935 [Sporosarcina sp. P16a]PIC91153.1 hypothetical protein CSV71_00645 [Sporosarcina sp. P21c]PIC93714.1 hypothetical protein CSV70_04275 [Sporosarcina sp. P25]